LKQKLVITLSIIIMLVSLSVVAIQAAPWNGIVTLIEKCERFCGDSYAGDMDLFRACVRGCMYGGGQN